jgi:parvulin-like peptidyl-prolyl isomerase
MKAIPLIAAALAASSLALAAPVAPDTPIIIDGPITVDALDIEAYMLRVPEIHHAEVRSSADRIATMADNIFIGRTLAARARKDGLDKDAAVQRRMAQLQEALLADLYLARMDKEAAGLRLDARARELFNADPGKYSRPAQVHVQYIMVGLLGRTREMAAELAKKVAADARAGKEDFLVLAARHSEDPEKNRNGGDLGWRIAGGLPDPIEAVVSKMSRKGEVSDPIEMANGYHIVKFIERRPALPATFEAARNAIEKEERERIAKRRHEDLVREIRSTSTVTVYRNNVEALVVPVDTAPKAKDSQAAPAAK